MINLTGQVFGDLVVLQVTEKRAHGNVVWICRCCCGNEVLISGNKLRCGDTKSCGCRRSRVTSSRNSSTVKHGHLVGGRPSPTYRVWRSMIARCEDPTHRNFHHYGGRGIAVCLSWRRSFRAFLLDVGERPEGMSLDRRDPNGDYCPSNCSWVPVADQVKNTRRSVFLTFSGETLILSDWAKRLGGRSNALRMRLKKGWPLGRALTEPFEFRKARLAVNPIPEKLRRAKTEFKQRYRHLLRSSGDNLTFEEWQSVLVRFGGRCAYCGSPNANTMDHVVPISKGGLHTLLNVVPACKSCNSSKKASYRKCGAVL